MEIDHGRQEKKPRAERICKVCKDGVEEELHIVAKCNAYQEERIVWQKLNLRTSWDRAVC